MRKTLNIQKALRELNCLYVGQVIYSIRTRVTCLRQKLADLLRESYFSYWPRAGAGWIEQIESANREASFDQLTQICFFLEMFSKELGRPPISVELVVKLALYVKKADPAPMAKEDKFYAHDKERRVTVLAKIIESTGFMEGIVRVPKPRVEKPTLLPKRKSRLKCKPKKVGVTEAQKLVVVEPVKEAFIYI